MVGVEVEAPGAPPFTLGVYGGGEFGVFARGRGLGLLGVVTGLSVELFEELRVFVGMGPYRARRVREGINKVRVARAANRMSDG